MLHPVRSLTRAVPHSPLSASSAPLREINQTMNIFCRYILYVLAMSFFMSSANAAKLSENGRALLPIVISPAASEQEKTTAQTLADYLKRISGGDFKVETAKAALTANTPGIVLGTAAHFTPALENFKTGDPRTTEDYLLRSHAGGLLVVGASELALEYGVWDVLYRLGHRQFFSGKNWEVIPSEKNLSLAVDSFEHPDYYSRRIWYGSGVLSENREAYETWIRRNRTGGGIALNTGHAYGNIIRRNKAEFDKHPEYLANADSTKLCVSNPGLQQLVINDALKQFEQDPTLQSVSLDPSDGGGWESDSCKDAQVYKSITDRVITLANLVAEAVTKKYPDKFIGVYAYNQHSPPPTIKVHPRVIPSIATSFIRGGYTLDQLLAGWNEKAEQIGIREYYGVYSWSRDLPGKAWSANPQYLQNTLPHFHSKGARFLSAESSDSWGPNGLGYYIASRIMWDVKEASRIEELKADFLEKAFGSAREPMTEFYRLIDGSNRPLFSADLIGRMYRQLDKALQSTQDEAVRARLYDLVLYTHYLELFSTYSQASGPARQAGFGAVLRYAWRIRKTEMIHTASIWRGLDRDKQVRIPKGSEHTVPEGKNPWKGSEPFTAEQMQKMVADGIVANQLLAFTPVSFSDDLVPAAALKLASLKPGEFGMLRGHRNFYTWVEKVPHDITLQVSGGHIYTTRGAAKFTLYPLAEAESKSVAEQSIEPDKNTHEIQLQTTFDGLHRIAISDGTAGTKIDWPAGVPGVFDANLESSTNFAGGRWSLYFYVPKGTKVVGGYRKGQGRILDGSGKTVLTLGAENNPGFWSVPVPPGQDGKAWMLSGITGEVALMTVPPYLARSAAEMLLPKEVVEADR